MHNINDISYMLNSYGNEMMDSTGIHLRITVSKNDVIII